MTSFLFFRGGWPPPVSVSSVSLVSPLGLARGLVLVHLMKKLLMLGVEVIPSSRKVSITAIISHNGGSYINTMQEYPDVFSSLLGYRRDN